ncbi:MAG: histidine phosphatase family protein [Chitinophagales bacterium]|nr:MAG: histidine phosphatase family protein [Chitinophagales bacterium]
MATIYLVRHGQASLGMSNYDALSVTGVEQSALLGRELLRRNLQFDKIICGAMQRHRQTALHCLEAMQVKAEIIRDSAWNEFDHMDIISRYEPRYTDVQEIVKDIGAAENPRQKIMNTLVAAFSRWTEGKHDDYKETWTAFCQRVWRGMERLRQQLGHRQRALVFTSGGPACVIAGEILGLTPLKILELQLSLANAAICQFRNSSSGLQLVTFNDHAHFQGENKKLLTWQ